MRAVGRRGRMGTFCARAPCERLCGVVQARQWACVSVCGHSLKLSMLPADAVHAVRYLRFLVLAQQADQRKLTVQLLRLATLLITENVSARPVRLLVSLSSINLCARRWPNVATVAKASFGWRLRLLPYIYTAFHDGHESGCPVMRPLFMAFPGDASVRSNNRQWCVAPSGRRHMTLQCPFRQHKDIMEAFHG